MMGTDIVQPLLKILAKEWNFIYESKITAGNGRRFLQYAGNGQTGTENAGADDTASGRTRFPRI